MTGQRVDDWLSMLDLPEAQATVSGDVSLAMLHPAEALDEPLAIQKPNLALAA